MKLEYYKGKMTENDNQYTVDKQRKVEEETSFMLEPLRDNVVFWHYFNTFFNTLPSFKNSFEILAWKTAFVSHFHTLSIPRINHSQSNYRGKKEHLSQPTRPSCPPILCLPSSNQLYFKTVCEVV